jgi:hypothetical protein
MCSLPAWGRVLGVGLVIGLGDVAYPGAPGALESPRIVWLPQSARATKTHQ